MVLEMPGLNGQNTSWTLGGIMKVMITIALKGASRDFYLFILLQSPDCAANCLQLRRKVYSEVARAQSCANHVQHLGHSSRATCLVPRGVKGQLSY